MKVHVKMPQNYLWFQDLERLLCASLRDLGHIITSHEEAETVIVIQMLEGEQLPGKRYILLLTEQKQFLFYEGKLFIPPHFHPDEIWSSDIDLPESKYLVLGYHPVMELPLMEREKTIDVGLVGSITARRKEFLQAVRNKPTIISQWSYENKIRCVQRSRISLNHHSYNPTTYTEWGRLSFLLANKAFVLSEKLYCPLPLIQFSSYEDYDLIVEKMLKEDKLREEMALYTYNVYKRDFHMCDVLSKLL